MDSISEQTLAQIIRDTRVAALGTLHEGKPNLVMVAYAFERDFSSFYIHVSTWADTPRIWKMIPMSAC